MVNNNHFKIKNMKNLNIRVSNILVSIVKEIKNIDINTIMLVMTIFVLGVSVSV